MDTPRLTVAIRHMLQSDKKQTDSKTGFLKTAVTHAVFIYTFLCTDQMALLQ